MNSRIMTDLAGSATVLNQLLGTSCTGSSLPIIETLGSLSGNTINFARPLTGITVLSVHVSGADGQSSGVSYSGTAFYLFNAGNSATGLDDVTLNRAGRSIARLFVTALPTTTAVPEPATWLVLVLDFAAVGGMMRRHKDQWRRAVSC